MYCHKMYEFLFLRDMMTRMELFVDFIDFFCHKLVCNFENIFTAVTSIFYFQNGYIQKGAFNDFDRI